MTRSSAASVSPGAVQFVPPAFRSEPEYEVTLGPEVADLCRDAEFGPDEEQSMVLDAIFGRRADGRSSASEIGVVCCRQNLKTGVFKQAELGWLYVTEERLVVWSAHEFATSQEAFRDLEELITGFDFLRREVKRITHGNGEEAIELISGSRMIFKTRTKGGGRGLSGSKVVLDEGFALRAMHMGALLPTMSAQPDPQVLYGSSAGLADSSILRDLRDRGRPGGEPRLAYFEWCAPPPEVACAAGKGCTHARTAVGCGCDRPELWQLANPAMPRRVSVETVSGERRALPPSEFGRERMGWWDDPAEGVSPISEAQWRSCKDPRSRTSGVVAVAFEVAMDRSVSAIAISGWREDGLTHGELVEHRPGTAWLADRVEEIADENDTCVLVMDPTSPAGALEQELKNRGFVTKPTAGTSERQLQLVGARDYAQACGALADEIEAERFRHIGQPPLDMAVEGVRTRDLADAWAWARKDSSADITPLIAVTLARHGLLTHGKKPEPPTPFALWG